MSYGLPEDVRKRALAEHDFSEGDICKRCGMAKNTVVNLWQRGLGGLTGCISKYPLSLHIVFKTPVSRNLVSKLHNSIKRLLLLVFVPEVIEMTWKEVEE